MLLVMFVTLLLLSGRPGAVSLRYTAIGVYFFTVYQVVFFLNVIFKRQIKRNYTDVKIIFAHKTQEKKCYKTAVNIFQKDILMCILYLLK